MSSSTQKILVTGVAGFLGSHLLDRFLAAGHTVVGIDNLSMGRLSNIEHHLSDDRFLFLQRDVTQRVAFVDLDGDFDCIVHLAAFKIPRYGKAIDTLRINYQGTDQVLQFATEIDCKCVLASTSDVYGRNPKVPFNEDDESVIGSSKVARWAYAVSKLFDEHLALAYQDSYAFQSRCCVFWILWTTPASDLVGGPQSVFIDAVLNEREIPLHGDGLRRAASLTSATLSKVSMQQQ